MSALLKRFWPIGLILLGLVIVWQAELHSYLDPGVLAREHISIRNFINSHFLASALIFVGAYAGVTALSLPGAALLSLAGGFFFRELSGTILVVAGATLGACLLFMAARTALRESLSARAGPWFTKLEQGFQKNDFLYLLSLRLIPLFPFFVVNLVPAFLGMRFGRFALATMIGIIPGSFVYVSLGTGLGEIIDQGENISLQTALSPALIIGLSGLGILCLAPVLYKAVSKTPKTNKTNAKEHN